MKRRGYTLIEIMIALAVILAMSSWIAANYYSLTGNSRNSEATKQIAQIKTAVVNYAATRGTEPRTLEVVNIAATATLTLRTAIPAGRPYLPCPDITGDGLEDRVQAPASTVIVSVTVGGLMVYTPDNYPLEMSGGCASSRGIVPWRTLDTHAADPWGNRYTYRVAGVYSNVQTGFDQNATGGPYYALRPFVVDNNTIRVSPILSLTVNSATPQAAVALTVAGFRNYLSPAVICDNSPCAFANPLTVGIVAGEFATVTTTLRVMSQRSGNFNGMWEAVLSEGDLISGVPFVVLSHGENGFGAVRADIPGYVCNRFLPAASASEDEIQNAVWGVDLDMELGEMRYLCPDIGDADDETVFVAYRGAGAHSEDDGYDDIVDWMSAHDLIAILTERGVLPAGLPPPIGLGQ